MRWPTLSRSTLPVASTSPGWSPSMPMPRPPGLTPRGLWWRASSRGHYRYLSSLLTQFVHQRAAEAQARQQGACDGPSTCLCLYVCACGLRIVQDLASAARTPITRAVHYSSLGSSSSSSSSSRSLSLSVPLVLSRRALLEKASYTLRLTAWADSVGTPSCPYISTIINQVYGVLPGPRPAMPAALCPPLFITVYGLMIQGMWSVVCARRGGVALHHQCPAHLRVAAGGASGGRGPTDALHANGLQLGGRQ